DAVFTNVLVSSKATRSSSLQLNRSPRFPRSVAIARHLCNAIFHISNLWLLSNRISLASAQQFFSVMRDDAVSLPSKMKHQRARKTPNGLTPNHISNIRVAAEAADIEIHEHFKFRLETYKTWAYCISRKSCPEILVDGFKSDLSNDFTLMINWLAITNEESRSILESS
ncbi:hypothetical protein GCK32_019116, partial [Trichostrongylus colubriformis]